MLSPLEDNRESAKQPVASAAPTRVSGRVLVVDDDDTVRRVVLDYLRASDLLAEECADGAEAVQRATAEHFHLVVLDLMLPGMDGFEVFRRLKKLAQPPAVIMLTAKNSESDRILGLEIGADDYLAKPFSPRELVLRVQSILRRSDCLGANEKRDEIIDGDLRVDLTARKVFRAGEEITLTTREFDLFAYMISHPDRVFSHDELMREVWGWSYGDPSTVTVHVRRLRAKIERDSTNPQRLVTVWGRGYRWESQK